MSKCVDTSLELKRLIKETFEKSNSSEPKFKNIIADTYVLDMVTIDANSISNANESRFVYDYSEENNRRELFKNSPIGKQVCSINQDYNNIIDGIKTGGATQLKADLDVIKNKLEKVNSYLNNLSLEGKEKSLKERISNTIANIDKCIKKID